MNDESAIFRLHGDFKEGCLFAKLAICDDKGEALCQKI